MKVKELISLLQTFPSESKVVMAGESGGIEEIESAYETLICDNFQSQKTYLFGLLQNPQLSTQYRLSNPKDDSEVGRETAVLIEY